MIVAMMTAMAGGVSAEQAEPIWMEGNQDMPRVCVSLVPDAGAFRSKDLPGWKAVRASLEAGQTQEAVAGLAGLKSHPAGRAVRAAAYIRGEGIAIDLERAISKAPDDACLRVLAAAVALRGGQMDEVKRHADKALSLWPTHPDVLALSILTADDRRARVDQALEKQPDDLRFLGLAAAFAEEAGDLAVAVRHLSRLVELGETGRRQELLGLALRAGELGPYLSAAVPGHPVQVYDPSEQADVAQGYYAYLGMSGPRDTLVAVLETSMGEVECTLDVSNAPMTILNFVGLARGEQPWTERGQTVQRPLYDGTRFHRVIPDFMIQGGDPEGTGRGSPGYRFADEPAPRGSFDRGGLLAMANSGPNTNGSQFFITEVPTPHLSGKHTIFGQCSGVAEQRVASIARVATAAANRPVDDVVLEHIRFEVR